MLINQRMPSCEKARHHQLSSMAAGELDARESDRSDAQSDH
jgi:hypothetical protein